MKSTIALVIAIVSLTLTSGNIIYSISIRKTNSELEAAALAFFRDEQRKREHYDKVQKESAAANAAGDSIVDAVKGL
jgi:predicted SnoaL-like aldol condensation-catalyzing enzyme